MLSADHENMKEIIKSLVHEVGHAALFTTGVNQTSLSTDPEEIIVENISQAICDNFDVRLKK